MGTGHWALGNRQKGKGKREKAIMNEVNLLPVS